MADTNKGNTLTVSGDSVSQRPAGSPLSSLGAPSSSNEGLSSTLPTGAEGNNATVEIETVTRSMDVDARRIAREYLHEDLIDRPISPTPSQDEEMSTVIKDGEIEGVDIDRPVFTKSGETISEDERYEDLADDVIEIDSEEEIGRSNRKTPPLTRAKRKAEGSPSQDSPSPPNQDLSFLPKDVTFTAMNKVMSKERSRKKPASIIADSSRGQDTRIHLKSVNELKSYDTEKLSEFAQDCLVRMELAINKTSNIQGMLKNHLVAGVDCMLNVVRVFRERLDDTGDISSYKLQNTNLTAQIRNLRKEEEVHKEALTLHEKENRSLRKEIETLREKIGGKNLPSSNVEKDKSTQSLGGGMPAANKLVTREEFPPLPQRTPKLRISRQQKLVDKVSKITNFSENESRSEFESTDENALRIPRGKTLPPKGEKTESRVKYRFPSSRVEDINVNVDTFDILKEMHEQISLLSARQVKLQDMLAGHPDGPPNVTTKKSKKSRKISSGSEVSDLPEVSDGGIFVQPESLPLVDTRPDKRALTNYTPRIRRRPPRTAAVSITSLNSETSYADILRKAREKINLDTLGIEDSKIRRGVNGGVIIEIPGADGVAKADILVGKLRDVLSDDTVRITRPTTMGEIRVWNFDDSISPVDIVNEISILGDCDESMIKLGSIRRMNNGLHSVWAKCPLSAAIKITATNKLKVGWTIARVELLESRPIQCYKCWRYGHVRTTCSYPEDRTGACFRCGERGHQIGACNSDLCCIICKNAGKPCNHRLGSFEGCLSRDTTSTQRKGTTVRGERTRQR